MSDPIISAGDPAALTQGAASPNSSSSSAARSAGTVLRQAREAKGLRLDVLAASIKVTTAKLEALESDRFDRLPDATFTRALAQAVCRSLKIDPAPVLALLPPPNGHRLEEVAEGLKTPFTERPGRLVPGQWLKLSRATIWIAALILVAALVLYLMPAGWIVVPHLAPTAAVPSAADAATTTTEPIPPGAEPPSAETRSAASPALLPGTASESAPAVVPGAPDSAPATVATTPGSAAPAASVVAAASTAVAATALQFTTTAPSWIGVTDAGGKSLIGRVVQPGETVDLDGALPLTLRVGHASTVQLKFRGEPIDLKKYIRDDVARFQLK